MQSIYLAKKFNNSTNVLFLMDDADALDRNTLLKSQNYTLVTGVDPFVLAVHKCPKGLDFKIMFGDNSKHYRIFEDNSVNEYDPTKFHCRTCYTAAIN